MLTTVSVVTICHHKSSYGIIDYIPRAVLTPMTYLFYNWKFVLLFVLSSPEECEHHVSRMVPAWFTVSALCEYCPGSWGPSGGQRQTRSLLSKRKQV